MPGAGGEDYGEHAAECAEGGQPWRVQADTATSDAAMVVEQTNENMLRSFLFKEWMERHGGGGGGGGVVLV